MAETRYFSDSLLQIAPQSHQWTPHKLWSWADPSFSLGLKLIQFQSDLAKTETQNYMQWLYTMTVQ